MKDEYHGALADMLRTEQELHMMRHSRELSEDRKLAHNSLSTFLEDLALSSSSKSERIEYLRNLSIAEFNSLLIHINGLLRNMPVSMWGKDYMDGLRITSAEDPHDISVDYIPPKHAHGLLDEFFVRMQKEISEENMDRYATKLRYAIVFAHVFADGNGRTSRYVQRLLSEGTVNIEDAVSTSHTSIGPSEANKLAVFEIFMDELPDKYRIPAILPKSPEDLLDYTYVISSMLTDLGYASPLKILALIKTFPEIDPYDLLSDSSVYKSRYKDSETGKRYDKFYEELQDKLFWKVQELLDRETDIKNVDKIFRKKIKDSFILSQSSAPRSEQSS